MKLLIFILFILISISCSSNTDKNNNENSYSLFTVYDIIPDNDTISGGREISITGNAFSSSCSVYFNDNKAEFISSDSDKIKIKTPPTDKGGYADIKILCNGKEKIIKNKFKYYGLPIHYQDILSQKLKNKFFKKYNKIETMDLNNDNLKDILLYSDSNIDTLVQNENGIFNYEDIIPFEYPSKIRKIIVKDMNNDGIKEWILLGETLSLYTLTDGDYIPSEILNNTGNISEINILDIDNDSDMDIFLISENNNNKTISILINDNNIFEDKTNELLPVNNFKSGGIAFGDLNNDKNTDIFIAGNKDKHYLLLNDGTGIFRVANSNLNITELKYNFNTPVISDLNNDGLNDIYMASENKDKIYIQQNDNTFIDETKNMLNSINKNTVKVIINDLDNDKYPDIFIIYNDGSFTLWHNDCENHYYNYTSKLLINDKLKTGIFEDIDNNGLNDMILLKTDFNLLMWLENIYQNFKDSDSDGIDDEYDNCKDIKNPKQINTDSFHFSCKTNEECINKYNCSLIRNINQKGYLFCMNKEYSWWQADYFCKNTGGRLAEIDSKELNDFLTEHITKDSYIGLTDTEEENNFVWESGLNSEFTNWDEHQPDNYRENENCASLRVNGKWNDLNCGAKKAFICEDNIKKDDNKGDACDDCPENNNKDTENSCSCQNEANANYGICNNTSCKTIYDSGIHKDGVYIIKPADNIAEFPVYCDMTTDGGGWTVIAVSKSEETGKPFDKDWNTVVNKGSGYVANINSNYFISMKQYISLANINNKVEYVWYAKSGKPDDPWEKTLEYKNHYLEEDNFYTWQGEEVWSLDQFTYYAGEKLTTRDKDNDKHQTSNCAVTYSSFGWYRKCHAAHYWTTTSEKNERGGTAVANGYSNNAPDAAGTYNAWYKLKIMIR